MRFCWIIVAALVVTSVPASAAIYTYSYTGKISSSTGSQYAVGDTVIASFQVNTETASFNYISGDGTQASYSGPDYYNGPITFATFGTKSDAPYFGSYISIQNNHSSGGQLSDVFELQATFGVVSSIKLHFESHGPIAPTVLSGVGIPATAPNPSLFSDAYITYSIGFGGSSPFDQIYTMRFDQTSAVPEPSTWAMMVLGFAGVGFMAYRRRNQTVSAGRMA